MWHWSRYRPLPPPATSAPIRSASMTNIRSVRIPTGVRSVMVPPSLIRRPGPVPRPVTAGLPNAFQIQYQCRPRTGWCGRSSWEVKKRAGITGPPPGRPERVADQVDAQRVAIQPLPERSRDGLGHSMSAGT
jgi:hypothetical protein